MKFTEQYPGFERVLASSGLTVDDCEVFQKEVFAMYDTLAESIPMESASKHWKLVKPAHAREAFQEVNTFANLLGLSPLLAHYVAIACSAHDLGRMVQANKRVGTKPAGFDVIFDDAYREIPYDDSDERHGYESVLVLRPILGAFCETEAGRWLLDAVLHHSLKANPTLEMCGGSEESLALCGIVRDIDKVLGFQEAADYTGNPERKAKERLQNWLKQTETDLGWGTELGRIDPAAFLMATPLEQPIDRQKCRSYEAYMLQFLKWLFGFARTEMQDVALHEGGPQTVAGYLLKQLEATPDQRAHLLAMLKSYRGGALLR
ncbi:MAG: hypothetical protein UX06_C0053G0003 [Candidatus Giovannonibacteria bacterium GW2011_GWA2_45_21]|uniref:HD domain-containing protein n=1 Tax=Candidatus Giovannonibacteria bacterium GW2011_GWA2_45_21 TaxID=1618649 RepID=A0A0G1Q1Y5_9BACT|nr:MAG: hypothetical protein UX06_C0053G0003 [Candidatus Giovannonibacteria bacterium GW2011_GWA2_45_21]